MLLSPLPSNLDQTALASLFPGKLTFRTAPSGDLEVEGDVDYRELAQAVVALIPDSQPKEHVLKEVQGLPVLKRPFHWQVFLVSSAFAAILEVGLHLLGV